MSRDYNQVIWKGHLTRDPEVRDYKSGKDGKYLIFDIASNRFAGKDRPDDVCYMKVISFNEYMIKDFMAQDPKKGTCALIIGELRQRINEEDRTKDYYFLSASQRLEVISKAPKQTTTENIQVDVANNITDNADSIEVGEF